jgi:voltage-gated potassium channel
MIERVKKVLRNPLTLLLSQIGLLVLYGALQETTAAGTLSFLLLGVLLLTATTQLTQWRQSRSTTFLFVALTFLVAAFHLLSPSTLSEGLTFGMAAVFLLYTSLRLLTPVMRRGRVSRDRVIQALCLYLMLGFTWAAIYRVLETTRPGSFSWTAGVPNRPVNMGDMLYFSFSTLTTVGYGDFVATRPLSRIMAVLEAAAGVLYVGVLVARLVSGYQMDEID